MRQLGSTIHVPHSHDKTPGDLHPAWQALMELCRNLGHGEIERLKIQDGLPVFAEKITEKIKLT